MGIAQKLYENGKITYMRTDCTFIAPEFSKKVETKIKLKTLYKRLNLKIRVQIFMK